MVRALLAAAVVAVAAGSASASPVLGFEEALGRIRMQAIESRKVLLQQHRDQEPPPGVIHTKGWELFPVPDQATLTWLSGRIPGLDTSKVRLVPLDVADKVMAQASAARTTYVDLLTDQAFRRNEIYYVPMGFLNSLDAKYEAGTMPVRGVARDGRPFQMQGLVLGQNKGHILYDRGFEFSENGRKFKVEGTRISSSIYGPGDMGIEGLSTWGAAIVCPWAKIQRMTKDGPYSVKVKTHCGDKGGVSINPVRVRSASRFRR